MAVNRRRETVTITLPAELLDQLKVRAAHEYRAVSREAELAIAQHLARPKAS